MTRRHWGKAGERLSEPEIRQRQQKAAQDRRNREEEHRKAYAALWAAGDLVPYRITLALDRRELHGPDVDRQCKARHPDVDHWEEGVLYPRWDQVEALAELTGFPVGFFVKPVDTVVLQLHQTTMWGHLTKADREAYMRKPPPDPVLQFEADAVHARMRGEPSPVVAQFHDQLELW